MRSESRDEPGDTDALPGPRASHGRAAGLTEDGGADRVTLSEPQRRHRGTATAAKFLGRFSRLTTEELRVPIQHWRRAVVASADQWFAAEGALARAMTASSRHREQERLLEQLVEALRVGGWFRRTGAVEQVGASEASVQYTTTLALLALLVRDHLAESAFATLYGPFASLIPPEELGPE